MQNCSIFRFIYISFFAENNMETCLFCKMSQISCFKRFPVDIRIGIRIKFPLNQTLWIISLEKMIVMC